MERITFNYAYFEDGDGDDTSFTLPTKRVELGIEGDYVDLDQIAKEMKRFLIAAGFGVDSLVINDSFGRSDDE